MLILVLTLHFKIWCLNEKSSLFFFTYLFSGVMKCHRMRTSFTDVILNEMKTVCSCGNVSSNVTINYKVEEQYQRWLCELREIIYWNKYQRENWISENKFGKVFFFICNHLRKCSNKQKFNDCSKISFNNSCPRQVLSLAKKVKIHQSNLLKFLIIFAALNYLMQKQYSFLA